MDMKTLNQQEYKQGCKRESLSPRQVSAGNTPSLQSIAPIQVSVQTSVPLPEEEALAGKLSLEIEQLEVWLENQQNAQQGSVSVIPTIKSLIHTRKALLQNILASF